MKVPNFRGIGGVIKTFAMANRPEILLGASVVATVGSTLLGVKGGYDARGIIEDEKMKRIAPPMPKYANFLEYKQELEKEIAPLTKQEIANLTWQCYIPATIAATTALGSTAGLHLVHVKDKKALATAGMAALEELKTELDSMKKEVGIPEETRVLGSRDADGKLQVEDGDGVIEELYLVRDGRSGRDIWSNEARIADAVNQVNVVMGKQGDCELNVFYGAAGFELLYPEGDDWGWSGDHIELKWKGDVRDDGRPVRRFDFRQKPKEGFSGA